VGVEWQQADLVADGNADEPQDILAVKRVGTGEVLLPVGHTVAVGITQSAIDAGRVEGGQAVGEFPLVGQAVVVSIGSKSALV